MSMAYSMEYRGLKAMKRLFNAVDAIREPGAANNVYALRELHDAAKDARELLGLDSRPENP